MAQLRPKRINNDGVNQTEAQYSLYEKLVAMVNDLKSKLNTLRTQNLILTGLKTINALAIGTTKPNVATVAFGFMVNGINYYKAAVAAGTAPAAETIPQNKYGLWRYEIGSDGTIDVAGAAANATGYATEALAIAAKPSESSEHVEIGYVTAMSTNVAGFVGATTDFDHADATVAYYNTAVESPAAVSLADLDLTSLGV